MVRFFILEIGGRTFPRSAQFLFARVGGQKFPWSIGMLAVLSPEAKIKNELRDCIVQNRTSRRFQALSARQLRRARRTKRFRPSRCRTNARSVAEMRELQTAVGDAPIDWSRVDKVLTAWS